MKNVNEINSYFEKLNRLDYYEFEDEDNSWYFLNKVDSEKITNLFLKTSNLTFKFIVVGTNNNGNYILLNESNKLLNYDIQNQNLSEFELNFDDILSFKKQ
jgi:hypothetical protein